MRKTLWRVSFYSLGIFLLCLGVTLNTKTGLGVSPVAAVPIAISNGTSWSYSAVLFWYYTACVGIQFLLKGRDREWKDLLQVPLSGVFSVIQGWMVDTIHLQPQSLWQSLAVLPFAVCFTGFGIAFIVHMDLVPNPADGVPFVISRVTKKEMGLVKNLVDAACVAISLAADLLLSGRITSLGLGTIVAMIFNGRAIAVFDRFFKEKVKNLAGLAPDAAAPQNACPGVEESPLETSEQSH